jgi:glycosyltransferase involved in cell wall biosynthesis
VQTDEPGILILEPSCTGEEGHHARSLLDLLAVLAGHRTVLCVNEAMPSCSFGPDIHALPVFKHTIYFNRGYGPRPNHRLLRWKWKLKSALSDYRNQIRFLHVKLRQPNSDPNAVTWRLWVEKWPELEAVLAEVVRAPIAHIVVPSCDVELACGLLDLRDRLPFLKNSVLHIRFIVLNDDVRRLTHRASLTTGTDGVRARGFPYTYFYVETLAMQRVLADAYELSSDIYPYLLVPPAVCVRNRTADETVTFGFFGGMRNEKGFQRLLPVLRRVSQLQKKHDRELKVIIHASDARGRIAENLAAEFAAISRPGLKIVFKAGGLSMDDYDTLFAEHDVSLLPYTGQRYKTSGSGVLSEALAMGKPVIYSAGLSFEDLCSPEHSIAASTDDEFAEAILKMAREIADYRRGALARASAYRTEVSQCKLLSRLGVAKANGITVPDA